MQLATRQARTFPPTILCVTLSPQAHVFTENAHFDLAIVDEDQPMTENLTDLCSAWQLAGG